MGIKRIFWTIILLWYFFSQLLSYLGYVEWDQVTAADTEQNTSTQLVAVLVDDKIYPSIENDIKRYASQYIQKKYPFSKALVFKINTKEYDAPEITKLLENLYFDGIKDQSSRLIGLVLIGEIPLPVVKYQDYIFPSIYPYADFLEQKYLWDDQAGYFLNTREEGQAEIWHGIINFGKETKSYQSFFSKLKNYEADPTAFVEKKIWYDDFIALKNNFLEENFSLYKNKLLFAEDLGYHRYTQLFADFLEQENKDETSDTINSLHTELQQLGLNSSALNSSIWELQKNQKNFTPTKLLGQKILSFMKDYSNLISIPLLQTINDNIKASNRWETADSHYQKLHLKDTLLLGSKKTNGLLKSINDNLEDFVDKKVEKEKYAMHLVVPTLFEREKNKKKRFLAKTYYIPEYKDRYEFFYFWKNANTIRSTEEFSPFRGSYRNLKEIWTYSSLLQDNNNPIKSKEDQTHLQKKSIGASYDLFSTQVEGNRGFNILNTEAEYALYQKEKTHAEVKWHCKKRRFWLKRSRVPCAKRERSWIGTCKPESNNPKDRADCENFSQFGNRVRGGATPLNIDIEAYQEQIYRFSGNVYHPESAWKPIFDIAGSVPTSSAKIGDFRAMKAYSSPTKVLRKEGEIKDPTEHDLNQNDVDYFSVNLRDKIFTKLSSKNFSLLKPKQNKTDEKLFYAYNIIPSLVEHKNTSAEQINGISWYQYDEYSEARNYYLDIKSTLKHPKDSHSSEILKAFGAIKNHLTTIKKDIESALGSTDSAQIKNLIPVTMITALQNLWSWQATKRGAFNDLLTKSYDSEILAQIESIRFRNIEQKIWLYKPRFEDILQRFEALENILLNIQTTGNSIFQNFYEISQLEQEIQTLITSQITSTGGNQNSIQARNSLNTNMQKIHLLLSTINQLDTCTANHSTLGNILGKTESMINIGTEGSPACVSEDEGGPWDENEPSMTNPFEQMLVGIKDANKQFKNYFVSDTKNNQIKKAGMNLLTAERPIDSPRYLSFQGIGKNKIQLIYPNIFKLEVFKGEGKNMQLKNPEEIYKTLQKYFSDKAKEYNSILEREKNAAVAMNLHYEKLASLEQLATPTLNPTVRPYQPFSYQEFVDAIGGERMLRSLAELLYYQNSSHPTKETKDNIKEEIQSLKKSFNINKKIELILKDYLSDKSRNFYTNEKKWFAWIILPGYAEKGYEVGYFNSNDDNLFWSPRDLSEVLVHENQTNISQWTDSDDEMSVNIAQQCGFNIHDALPLYNFQTGKFDWWEGLKCRLKETKESPFRLKLSFEDFKLNWSSFDPWFLGTNETEENLQTVALTGIQITTATKKIWLPSRTGSIEILWLKDHGNLTITLHSTGGNCLIIHNQESCKKQGISLQKNAYTQPIILPFQIAKKTTGTIITNIKICSPSGNCTKTLLNHTLTPWPLSKITIGGTQKKILAGAYTLIPVQAFDAFGNQISRTLENFNIEVDKGHFILWGKATKKQEISDFSSLNLLYQNKSEQQEAIIFSLRNSKGKLISQSTFNSQPGNLHLTANNEPLSKWEYHLNDQDTFSFDKKGNMQINTKKVLPVQIEIRDNKGNLLPIDAEVSLKSDKGLIKTVLLERYLNWKKQQQIKIIPINSIAIKDWKADFYLIPWKQAGEDQLRFLLPWRDEQSIPVTLHPGQLAQISFTLNEESLLPNKNYQAILLLQDAWWNIVKDQEEISLLSSGPAKLSPQGNIKIEEGKQKILVQTTNEWGILQLNIQWKKIEKKLNRAIKQSFLTPLLNSWINVMYLNLFWTDWGNQRWYFSDHQKISEEIIKNSGKTLAITTQLIDPHKIKKTSLILKKGGILQNFGNLVIQAQILKDQLSLDIEGIWNLKIADSFKKIKSISNIKNTENLTSFLKNEKEKSLFLYNTKAEFSFKDKLLSSKDIYKSLTLKLTDEMLGDLPVREVFLDGEFIANGVITNLNFSRVQAQLKNSKYSFWSVFVNGSSHQQANAIFQEDNTLKESYQGYDSIQDSADLEKYIGFRGHFRNISSFAGGDRVGEATLPFGSEFLINIGDPLIKRVEENTLLNNSAHDWGLGTIVFSDPSKIILKTIDIDYNHDGLRDLLIVYKDGSLKLQKQYPWGQFQDMGPLMISAEPIDEIFVGDIDWNSYEDIIIKNKKQQLRVYFNRWGIFDVDWKIACLNTNIQAWKQTKSPENLDGVSQLFLKDMDVNGSIDIVTLDTLGYLKIFYGEGKENNHSYVSKESSSCDLERYTRQTHSHKTIKKIWLKLQNIPVKDGSLIRRNGLVLPKEETIQSGITNLSLDELGITIPENILTTLSNWEISTDQSSQILQLSKQIDPFTMAQNYVNTASKYLKNPFIWLLEFKDWTSAEEQAFIRSSDLWKNDPLLSLTKTYKDLNWGRLETGDRVQVHVEINNNNAEFSGGGAFFDEIRGPWRIIADKTWAPKNLHFIKGKAKIHPGLQGYSYYLNDLEFAVDKKISYSYEITYSAPKKLLNIMVDDLDIEDYSEVPIIRKATEDGLKKDGIPDIIIQSQDWCNKKQALLFNTQEKSKRNYRESMVDLQALANAYSQKLEEQSKKAETQFNANIAQNSNADQFQNLPGLTNLGENFATKDILQDFWTALKNGENWFLNLNFEFFGKEIDDITKNLQNIADTTCKGFSFGLESNLKSCKGLPVPFNQAFLAPGNYHLMGCIPLEPLTKSLGKGLPIFHFPGTLTTPAGPVPIPWGLKGPRDGFLRPSGGTRSSWIRIYAAPTLTSQLGLAICLGSYQAGMNLPSPFSDIGGNCIVTAIPLPCWTSLDNQNENSTTEQNQSYLPWTQSYQQTSSCSQISNSESPFVLTASPLNNNANFPTSLPEGSFLWWAIQVDYDNIVSSIDEEQNGIEIEGVKVQWVQDINNKILWGIQQGLQKKLVGRFDRQVQYWLNNLLRFRVEFIFPDLQYLEKELSSFTRKEVEKLATKDWIIQEKEIQNAQKFGLSTLKNYLPRKETLTVLNLADGDNPFEKLQTFFNSKEIVTISSQQLNIVIPQIYSEDIEAYANYLKTRYETNKEVLESRVKITSAAILSCEADLKDLKGENFNSKQKECKALQKSKNQLMQIQAKFDKTSEKIFQNTQTLELYKRFPLEVYDWLHVSDRYLEETSALLSNFFWYINYRMEINAARFSQYTDAIITILGVVKTYQIMVDLFVDWGKKCWKCTMDTYDQYSCKLGFLCPDLPIIPIPNIKIPSLYIDLSQLHLGLDITLPRFNFIPKSVDLPKLPNVPEPPQIGANFSIDFTIPDIPLLPEPPTLPDLPSLIPQVDMQLPVLPPAPSIPELPNQISLMLSIAKKLSKIYCIIKSGIGLVGENSVKARIEQMTQRSYEVPWVDRLDLTQSLKQTPLQGIDIQVDSSINLKYNFDAFYALLKSIVDNINSTSYNIISNTQGLSTSWESFLQQGWGEIQETIDEANLQFTIGYKKKLKKQIKELQKTLNPEEQTKFMPVLALTNQGHLVKKNEQGFLEIEKKVSNLLTTEKNNLQKLAQFVKEDYSSFLKHLTQNTLEHKEPILLSFSTPLLEKKEPLEKLIKNNNATKLLVETEEKRLNGYLNALEHNTAKSLGINENSYQKSKNYLLSIKEKLNQRKSMKEESYPETILLSNKNPQTTEKKTLLAQTHSQLPTTATSTSTDFSSYIDGILLQGKDRNFVNVIHSKYNTEQILWYYEQDINQDKKADLIFWDSKSVAIKYADKKDQDNYGKDNNYYLITPQLQKKQHYQNLSSQRFSSRDKVKIYDDNREIKNFKFLGQTFDTLSFSRTNRDESSGFIMRMSNSIDAFLEKTETHPNYVLFLPEGTAITQEKLQVENSTFKIQDQLGKNISEILFYNPADSELSFTLQNIPRNRKYLQIAGLKKENEMLYTSNSPRSNQIVWGRQLIADNKGPKVSAQLIRGKKNTIIDEGLELEGMIGTYYDIKVNRKDENKLKQATIKKAGKTVQKADFESETGTLQIKNLFFTGAIQESYQLFARDSQGNESRNELLLTIGVPSITIEQIEQISGWKEGIENPIQIQAKLEKDIDDWTVSFERKRNKKLTPLIAIENGKKKEHYPVSTDQDHVLGAYYDFWELIWLYSVNKKLIATVNAKNGEILIQKAFKKTVNLKVDFWKGHPVVKLLQWDKVLFEILLQSQALVSKEILKGTLFPLEGPQYGIFNGGEVLLQGKIAQLFIGPQGTLWTEKNEIWWEYYFDKEKNTVHYSLFEHSFWEKIADIAFKVKPL